MHPLLIVFLPVYVFQRIVSSLFHVFRQVFIGIHKVDKFPEEKAHPAKVLFPDILFIYEKFLHKMSKTSGCTVNIHAPFLLAEGKLPEPFPDCPALTGILFADPLCLFMDQALRHETAHLSFIQPVILHMIIGKKDVHRRRIGGDLVYEHELLLYRMDLAPVHLRLGLALVERGQQDHGKRHIIGQGHLPHESIILLEDPAQSAVICPVFFQIFNFKFRLTYGNISKHLRSP